MRNQVDNIEFEHNRTRFGLKEALEMEGENKMRVTIKGSPQSLVPFNAELMDKIQLEEEIEITPMRWEIEEVEGAADNDGLYFQYENETYVLLGFYLYLKGDNLDEIAEIPVEYIVEGKDEIPTI